MFTLAFLVSLTFSFTNVNGSNFVTISIADFVFYLKDESPDDSTIQLKRKAKQPSADEGAELKETQTESRGSSIQPHSEPETDDVDGDDEGDETEGDKTDVTHAADGNGIKPAKIRKV